MYIRNLLDPDEWIIEFWIYGLQVFQTQRFVQNTFVKGQRETCVDKFAMEQGLERHKMETFWKQIKQNNR